MFRRELEAERATLNQEKLTLAAEVLRRPTRPVNETNPIEVEDEWLGPRDLPFELEKRRRHRWWLVIVPILASGLATAAYFITAPDVATWLAYVGGP
jgi:hypothetical protein